MQKKSRGGEEYVILVTVAVAESPTCTINSTSGVYLPLSLRVETAHCLDQVITPSEQLFQPRLQSSYFSHRTCIILYIIILEHAKQRPILYRIRTYFCGVQIFAIFANEPWTAKVNTRENLSWHCFATCI